jgi:ABC-type glutathione transport system ATPase component
VQSDSSTLGPDKAEPISRDGAAAIDEKGDKDNRSSVEDDSEDDRRHEQVHQLARRLTQASTYSTAGQSPFEAEQNGPLDPNGENFSARAWAKAMLHLQTRDEKAHPLRTAGVSFRNLNVHGFGSATDYQKSVGNVWLEGIGLAKKLLGQEKQRKIDILQNLDGLVESGEMLVVLGPPGSGCSTFLKTIAGETHGFFVDSNSSINYQGMFCCCVGNITC